MIIYVLFPPLLFHLSILSEVRLLNFLTDNPKTHFLRHFCWRKPPGHESGRVQFPGGPMEALTWSKPAEKAHP